MQRFLGSQVGFWLVGALLVLSLPYHPGLRSPNELCRLWQTRAIVDAGTLDITSVLRTLGMVGDLSCTAVVDEGNGRTSLRRCVGPEAPTSGVVAVHYYPSKAPLVSFLAVPAYWVLSRLQGGLVGEVELVAFSRLTVTVLPTLLLLWLLRRFLRSTLSPELSDVLVVVYALGTLAFSYAEAFMSHQLTAVLLFACFFVAWQVERGAWKVRGYVLAGLLAGAAVMAEYTAALGVLCVAAYVVAARWKRWPALGQAAGLVVVGAAPLLLALMAYHQACFGSPLTSGYKYLNDAAYQGWHVGGFLGIRTPDARAFFLSLFSPLRGLFVLSPFLAAAFWGVKEGRQADRPTFVLLLALCVGNAYFTSSFTYDSWGWAPGPRHLTPLLPFLMLPLGRALEAWKAASAPLYSVVAGLCLSGVVVTGLVCFVNYVPDDVSTSLFGLSVPLLADGFWPVSWLAVAVPNPASGAVLVALLAAASVWVGGRWLALGARPLLVALAVAAHVGALWLATKDDDHDRNARKFLEQIWSVPSGQTLRFR